VSNVVGKKSIDDFALVESRVRLCVCRGGRGKWPVVNCSCHVVERMNPQLPSYWETILALV
jgi:hypothetical protein